MDAKLRRLIFALGLCAATGCYDGIDDAGGVPWDGVGEIPGSDEDTDDGIASDGEDSDGGDSSSNSNDGGSDDPSGGTGGADPSGGDSDPSGGDPTGSDPTSGDPSGGDPTGGDPTGGDPTGDPTGGNQGADVPNSPYCQGVMDWDPQWAALEEEILQIVNQRRSEGANCGTEGSFGPAGPLTMDPALRCSSRVHSMDMAQSNYFDHTNLMGESPFARMQQAGYNYSFAGENIAGGNSTAAATMQQWMNSDGHCANVMNPNFEHLGVGYHPGGQYGHMWTQNFGAQ